MSQRRPEGNAAPEPQEAQGHSTDAGPSPADAQVAAELAAAQQAVARELEAGMAALMDTALARLDALAARMNRLDATLEHAHSGADRLGDCRRQSAALRQQMQSARRDLLLAETLYTDTAGAQSNNQPPNGSSGQ